MPKGENNCNKNIFNEKSLYKAHGVINFVCLRNLKIKIE